MPPKRGKRPASGNAGNRSKRLRRNIADAKSLESEVVIAQVGSGNNKQTFVIEKETIVSHSEYFTTVLALKESSGGSHDVHLLEEDPVIFNIFRHFVTTGQIFGSHDNDQFLNNEGRSQDREWRRLMDAWKLGERLQSCSFKDAVVDTLIDKTVKQRRFSTDIQKQIYPHSNSNSAIRRWIVDMTVWEYGEDAWRGHTPTRDIAMFYYDLASALMASKRGGIAAKAPYSGQDTCKYHEHDLEKSCYKTMF